MPNCADDAGRKKLPETLPSVGDSLKKASQNRITPKPGSRRRLGRHPFKALAGRASVLDHDDLPVRRPRSGEVANATRRQS